MRRAPTLLPALLACALLVAAHAAHAAHAASAASATSATSARGGAANDPLRAALAGTSGLGTGVYAVHADGTVLAAQGADLPLVPASTLKVVTAVCALEALGPSSVHRTLFAAPARPAGDGTLPGPLYLVGGGDPALRAEDLWSATQDLARAGVKRVAGDLVLDDTLFEEPGRPAAWPPQRAHPTPYDAPQGALALAWNAAEIVVTGGARAGDPAAAETSPLRELVTLETRARTGTRTALNLRFRQSAGSPPVVTLTGTIARGTTFREWIHLGHPTTAVASTLRRLLPLAEIEVQGALRRGATPPGTTPLVERRSLPLGKLVRPVLRHSSNFGAEMLLRSLDAAAGHRPGTTAGGAARLLACVDRLGAGRAGVTLLDGSGYARGNRLTARALVAVLQAARQRPWAAPFRDALPPAGEDGSLQHRLRGLGGRVRAKTGTLDGVAALAGYLTARDGSEVAFAVLLNRRKGAAWGGSAAVDRIVAALAQAADAHALRTAGRSRTGSATSGRTPAAGSASRR